VQLSAPRPPAPAPSDVASALTAARDRLGQRPAVTVLSPRGRQEQGVASLAQWAAKGAHLLETELLLEPGERLRLDAPLSWTSAAVALAAWWAGLVVVLGEADAAVHVVHEDRPVPSGGDVLLLGDALDGGPREPRRTGPEPWVRAVQSFPDQPPRPRADGDASALRAHGHHRTQRDLLLLAGGLGVGTLGVEPDRCDPITALVAVALRPLVVERPTVILHEAARDEAAGDRVATWLADAD
jgi:uncharacterized protein (TIGR03089 family)